MTYYNGNAYRDEITEWAHDDCLPDDQFDTHDNGHRQQKSPWNWSPVWGAPEPCTYCAKAVR